MYDNDKFYYVNIRDYINNGNDEEIGEPELIKVLSDFSCSKNMDVEHFLKNNAIEFTKKNQSVTYLVFDHEDGQLLGYFSIAIKPLTVNSTNVSNTFKKKIERVSECDKETQTYTMSAYLIAQLGKNYTNGLEKRIKGDELLEIALGIVEGMQYMGGGMVVFLEANNENKLLEFYKRNKFQQFNIRCSKKNKEQELVQLLKIVKQRRN